MLEMVKTHFLDLFFVVFLFYEEVGYLGCV